MANVNLKAVTTPARPPTGQGSKAATEIVAPALAPVPDETALFQARMALTIKGCAGHAQKAAPQRKMLRRIAKMHVHPGVGLGIKRWHLYRVGTTIQEAKTVPGLCHLDITFWEKNGLVEMRDCTDEEYAAAMAAWVAAMAAQPKAAQA